MAKTILNDCFVSVGGVTLSDHVSGVVIEQSYDENDVTAMGDVAKTTLLGIQDASITITFFQDFASAKVDQTLNPFVGSNTGATVIVKPVSSATVSSTNPTYTMLGLLSKYMPINGSVGNPSTTEVTFKNGSSSGITRATA